MNILPELPVDELTGLLPSQSLRALLDPEATQDLGDPDFQEQMAAAWSICDQSDLQTDIWRGRILALVRDREKQQGEGRGFLKWLQAHDITTSQAYRWLHLAESADTLLGQGVLDPELLPQFSKRAFVETAQAAPEVQQMIVQAAQAGQPITRRAVRQLQDEWIAVSAEVIPDVIREKAAQQTLPTRLIAPLAKELENLPPQQQTAIQSEITAHPDADSLKQITATARHLNRFLQTAPQCAHFVSLDLDAAHAEALDLGCLSQTTDLITQVTLLEQNLTRLYLTWKRLGSLADQVYISTGANTPHLRQVISAVKHLTHPDLVVPLESTDPIHIKISS